MTDRKKPSAGIWITVALVAMLVGYPLSFGPACWLAAMPTSGFLVGPHKVMIVYWPLGRAATWNAPVGTALQWWIELGKPASHIILVPTNPSGTNAVLFGQGPK